MKRPLPANDLRMKARVRVKAAPIPLSTASVDHDGRKGIQSVDIAFSILRALERAEGPLSLQKLATLAGQQSSKVHHYLVSLIRSGMVIQNSAGHYDLGSFALQIGLSALSRLDPIEQGTEAIVAFRDRTGEAAFLAVWGNRGPTIIRYVEGTRPVTVEVRAGLVLPVLSSATGHVFLTWLPEAKWLPVVRSELETVEKDPGRSIAKHVSTIREKALSQGRATIDGDLLPRIAAISVPVFGHDGTIVCALTTLGWRGEVSLSTTSKASKLLVEAGQKLSQALGHRGT